MIMKKLLAIGLSACLLFSFTGSAFAASQTTSHAKNKVVHTALSKKKTITNVKYKKHTLGKKSNNVATVHKKTVKKPKATKITKTTNQKAM
jgi:uncharacterized protein (UPF0333 family)